MIKDHKNQRIFKKINVETNTEIDNMINNNEINQNQNIMIDTKGYSKDELLLNKLSKVELEMVPNQIFVTNFLSLQNSCNGLLLYYGNNDNEKNTSLFHIMEEMREKFLIKEKNPPFSSIFVFVVFFSSISTISSSPSFIKPNLFLILSSMPFSVFSFEISSCN